ncbi:MAG: serine/threonine-protein kinase [Polyangiaceae bacterium]
MTYVLQALDAIAEAHALGIVHRDLKPANLFLARTPEGDHRVKVLDFGISKIMGDAQAGSITATSTTLGSPLFMSPEQAVSTRDVDARSDVWSMGVVLYNLLTGRTPFEAATVMAVCMKVIQTEAAPPSALRPDLPPDLVAVVMRCLSKDRNHRYANAAELAAALAPFAAPAGSKVVIVQDRESRNSARAAITATHSASSLAPPGPLPDVASGDTLLAPPPARKRRGPLLLALAGVLAVGAAAGAFGLAGALREGGGDAAFVSPGPSAASPTHLTADEPEFPPFEPVRPPPGWDSPSALPPTVTPQHPVPTTQTTATASAKRPFPPLNPSLSPYTAPSSSVTKPKAGADDLFGKGF